VGNFSEKLPGIEYVLGWQTDRMLDELPVHVIRMWFILALIWVGVIVFGVVEGWSLAVAIGQLVAASVALLFISVR
jgi:hypothetical protein